MIKVISSNFLPWAPGGKRNVNTSLIGERVREIERVLLEGITTLPRDNVGTDFVEVSLNQVSIVIVPGRLSAFTNSTRKALQQ
jgi:hypothetical protein